MSASSCHVCSRIDVGVFVIADSLVPSLEPAPAHSGTSVQGNALAWFRPDGMELYASRWEHWGFCSPTISQGARWSCSVLPSPSSWPNYRSTVDNAEAIHAQLECYADGGIIEWCYQPVHSFAHNFCPFGAIVKPNGSLRLLLDPTIVGVNECMTRFPMTLPTPFQALLLTDCNSVLGKRDPKNGFYHIVLHEDSRRYMAFRDPLTNRIGRYVALPFGAAQSPAIFCEITEWASHVFNWIFTMHDIQASCIVYVDDFFVVAVDHFHLTQAFSLMDHKALLLGLEFKPEKNVGLSQPLQQIEFLGVLLRADVGDLMLPDSKRLKYLSELDTFISSCGGYPTVLLSQLEGVVGRLAFASSTVVGVLDVAEHI